jgi:tetratricopeptide (TPR) repeat protein
VSRDERLASAVQNHRAGRLSEAEEIYREVLRATPQDANALHLFGVLTGQLGKTDEAIDLIRQAITVRPVFPEAHRNLATLLLTRGGFAHAAPEFQKSLESHPLAHSEHKAVGEKFAANADFQAAIYALKSAVTQKPDFAEAHNDLGTILSIVNKLDEAIAAHRQATTIKPDFAEAHYALGNALARKARDDEALESLRRTVQIRPDFADAHLNIGNLLRRRGRLDEAVAAYQLAIKSNPSHSVAFVNLGHTLRTAGLFEQSLAAFTRAVEIDPNYGPAHLSQAIAFGELQQFDEARSAHARGAALVPGAPADDVLGQLAVMEGNPVEAAAHFRRAIQSDPNFEAAWNGLGVALQSQGKFDEAAKCFRKKLELAGEIELGRGYLNLTNVGQVGVNPEEIARLSRLLDDKSAATDNRVAAGFALGKILDSADRFGDAFAADSKANLLWKRLRESLNDRYDPDAASRNVDRIVATFTSSLFAQNRVHSDPSQLPVFVVGMPRSGTTLVQQIAASHPQVHGAGELKEISHIAALGNLDRMHPSAARHLAYLATMNPSATRVMDKTPANIQYLGQIALLYPGARVIFCRRDPLDTCLSCYFQWFTQGNLFSFDLLHCGHEYRLTERLREHWLGTSPLNMLEVKYESLVADLEGQSRRLIDFLGLPWNPACLEFHRSGTMVLTASAWQVRQPIYQSSVGRWRKYEQHLRPLIEMFGR